MNLGLYQGQGHFKPQSPALHALSQQIFQEIHWE